MCEYPFILDGDTSKNNIIAPLDYNSDGQGN